MAQRIDYIATWFYRESSDEACFYPQAGRGDSSLLHSVYMQIQVPFFTTFRHYNPKARLIFFTNLTAEALPPFLTDLFQRTGTEIVTLPYTCHPPKGWYKAWMNQFYLYDIFKEMEKRMQPDDTLLLCDADCLCRMPLDSLFQSVRENKSALYDIGFSPDYVINDTTLEQMDAVYTSYYGTPPSAPIRYYGGEFIALNREAITGINREVPGLQAFNFAIPAGNPRLHEEAHMLSVLAERLGLRNDIANRYVKRLWTNRHYNNVVSGDENLPVWHLPAEKKRGLYYLYRMLEHDHAILDEKKFWKKAGVYCGIPHIGWKKKTKDWFTTLRNKFSPK